MPTRKTKKETMFSDCNSAKYAVMLTHHELQSLELLLHLTPRAGLLSNVYRKVKKVRNHSKVDHRWHLSRGTCVLQLKEGLGEDLQRLSGSAERDS